MDARDRGKCKYASQQSTASNALPYSMFTGRNKRKNPLYIASSILIIIGLALLTGSVAIIAAAILVILVLFYPFFLFLWEQIYGVEDLADQVFHAHTDDAWNIALHFHRPAYPRPGALPVLLCHGLAVNKYGVDLDRGHSLAYYLRQNGFPVFVISLRGTGKSYHASRYGYRDFCFDDIVEYDVPAVIKKVRDLTGAPRINWIGHSMGAMIAYAAIGRRVPESDRIHCLVSLGGPGRIDHARSSIWAQALKYPWMGQLLDLKFGAQVVSPVTGRIISPIEELVYNKEIVSSTTIRRLMKNGIENIAPGLLKQFAAWMRTGREFSQDGVYDYRSSFENITIPVLYIAGARDHVAPVESIRFAYNRTASKDKTMLVMGREDGVPFDYCHTGLVLADRALMDVFPRVLEFLNRYGMERRKRSLIQKWRSKLRLKKERRSLRGRRNWQERGVSDVISA